MLCPESNILPFALHLAY